MSQFGNAAKNNPPWVRSAQQSMPTGVSPQHMQSQMMNQAMGQTAMNPAVMVQYQQQQQQQQQQQVYQQMQQQPMQQSMSMSGMGGMSQQAMSPMNQLYPQVATVSYPTPRALNPTAFQTQQQVTPQPVTALPANPSSKQRVFTGTVTKVHDNFGFVDEDVFFQSSCCVKGSNPVVGDRVLVEASYNPQMPFKWNATRIQVLPMTGGPRGAANIAAKPPGGYNAVPPPSENSGGNYNTPGRGQKRGRRDDRPSGGGNKERSSRDDDDEAERKRRRDERQKERDAADSANKDKAAADKPAPRKRSKSPRAAPRRRARAAPRYMVQIPKIALDLPEADVLELRRRYTNMYVPSDFFCTNFRWVDAFPPHSPFALDRPCGFHVLHKEVDRPGDAPAASVDPPDADYIFSAKVMLISMPSMEEIYRKCCPPPEDKDGDSAGAAATDPVHPTRLVNFLVGLRGKNETMAVGGPWSPSLDGADPEKDPSVLIKTAVRSCKALTGVDLSHCTQWYRFLELYYRRAETTSKGRVIQARVETVVLFLPDVWSCVPSRLEFDAIRLDYKRLLEKKEPEDAAAAAAVARNDEDDEKDKDDALTEAKKEPTHYADLDPKTMKVGELREELAARSLNAKGLKTQLLARLAKVLKSEAAKDNEAEDEEDAKADEIESLTKQDKDDDKDEEKTKKEDEEKKKSDEKERLLREKRYALPETPHLLVHPSRTAKGGKFDCTVMSLSLLLDYRTEDTKEHSFEVSLFAELFNEMLMRDYGFRIYRALHEAPEPVKEEAKKDKEREKRSGSDKDKKSDDKDKDKDKKKESDKKDDKSSSAKEKEDKAKAEEKEKEDDEEEEEEDEEDDDTKSTKSKDKDGKEDKDKKRGDKDKDKKKKERVKLVTVDPQLLLSFSYFDQSHCGYIFDKDIEELLFTLGLNLSRAQVRKLVQKVVTRDSLHYRKLTDRPQTEAKDTTDKTDEAKKALGNGVAEPSLESLAYGNKRLLPAFNVAGPASKRARKEAADNEGVVLPDGFVTYKGSLLDVAKLMDALKRSEKARSDTEDQMVAMRNELESVKTTADKSASCVKELTGEVKEVRATLAGTNQELALVQANSATYLQTLKEVHEKIVPVIRTSEKDGAGANHVDDQEVTSDGVKSESRWSGKDAAEALPVVKSEKAEDAAVKKEDEK